MSLISTRGHGGAKQSITTAGLGSTVGDLREVNLSDTAIGLDILRYEDITDGWSVPWGNRKKKVLKGIRQENDTREIARSSEDAWVFASVPLFDSARGSASASVFSLVRKYDLADSYDGIDLSISGLNSDKSISSEYVGVSAEIPLLDCSDGDGFLFIEKRLAPHVLQQQDLYVLGVL